MDANALSLLEVDLRTQMTEISRTYAKVHERLDGYEHLEERREGLAFHLHNLYCAFEDLFRMVAEAFENQIGDGGSWHVELLSRMRVEIPGVRPRLLDDESYDALNELRAFRHVFRHAYAFQLKPEKLAIVVHEALDLEKDYARLLEGFLRRCWDTLSGTE